MKLIKRPRSIKTVVVTTLDAAAAAAAAMTVMTVMTVGTDDDVTMDNVDRAHEKSDVCQAFAVAIREISR